MTKKYFRKGVSIIEVLVVIAIIGILSGIVLSGFLYFKKGSAFNLSAQQIVNLIRRAKSKSMAVHGDSAWGVEITPQQAIVFKGTDFASRNQSLDESVILTGIANVSGASQFVFEKFTGIPQNAGSLTVSSEDSNKTIQVNEKGIVNF